MPLDHWLAFAAASAVLLIIPGPTVLLAVSYALGQGSRVALPIALGVGLGDLTSMTLSILGIGALLSASATLFAILKWVGAGYLIWLGIKLFRAGGNPAELRPERQGSPLRLISHAWLVTALNPKGIVFFVAFLPQFVDPSGDLLVQMLILEATFITMAVLNTLSYSLLASRARRLVSEPRVLANVNRAGGSVLVAAGIATIAFGRSR